MIDGIAEQTNYCAFCEDCDFYGRDYDNEEAAQQELDEHRESTHPPCPKCGHHGIRHLSAAGPTIVCNRPMCGETTLTSITVRPGTH